MGNIPGIKDSEQQILNSSFDSTYGALAVIGLGIDGTNAVRNNAEQLAIKVTVSGNVTYVAVAPVGTAQATAKWQVKKIDESVAGTTVITWADGDAAFNNVATDLTALTFS